jgi:hypothetical protein
MKFLAALGLLVVILALTTRPTIEEKVEVQIEESQEVHDSAMQVLVEIHEANDSLLIEKYFGKGSAK